MKKTFQEILVINLMILFLPLLTVAQSLNKISLIRVDQFGYYEDQIKIAVLANPQLGINAADSYIPSNNINLVNASNGQVVMGLTKTIVNNGNTDNLSGDILWHVDFTSFKTRGTYYIHDQDKGVQSHDFVIGANNKYDNLLRASLKQLYYQRCGHAKVSDNWSDGACHVGAHQDTDCKDYHGVLSSRDLSGGWHDAGDYGKYVGYAYPAVHDLLSAYLINPSFWNDFEVGIPESNNGKPDILDEVKWELDWLLKMQVSGENENTINGGLLHIVGMTTDKDNYWSKHVGKPASQDESVRYFLGVTGQATCSGASMLAYGAYVFNKAGMITDANNYLKAAEEAWTWTENNPSDLNSNFENYPANQMDPYFYKKDLLYGSVDIALYEAACFLQLLTGKTKYLTYIKNNTSVIPQNTNLRGALLNYAIDSASNSTISNNIKNKYLNFWGKPGVWHFNENGVNLTDGHRYLFGSPYWGANLFLCREAALVYNASLLDQNNLSWRNEVLSSAIGFMHGCNPLDLIFLTGVGGTNYGGDRYLEVFYHGDSNMANTPPPCCIPGGPNGSFSGNSTLLPVNSPPLKRFDPSKTATPSYQYFEGQIKVQAAYVYLMATVMKTYGHKTITSSTTSIAKQKSNNQIYPNPSNSIFYLSDKTSWTIYNIMGKKILENTSQMINLSKYPNGMYILKDKNGTQKLIKK